MPLTKKQLEERLNYIGGSDAAAVLGLSRWCTPLEIWAEKTRQIPPEDIEDKLAVKVGKKLEDLVADLFAEKTGLKVHRVKATQYHPEYPFLAANLDRRVVGTDELLECKTCSGWKAKEWEGEEIPQEYIIQVLHQLAVTGKNRGYIAVLIGGNQDFKFKVVERDDKVIKEMIAKEVHFWKTFVEPKVMPHMIKPADSDVLFKLFPESQDPDPIELTDEANRLIETLEAADADLKTVEANIDRMKNELKILLKEHPVGVTDRFEVTWKEQTRSGLDSKAIKENEPKIAERYKIVSKTRVLRWRKLKPVTSNKK